MVTTPNERVRRKCSSVGQVKPPMRMRRGETAYEVQLLTDGTTSRVERRPLSCGKVSIPVEFRGDESEYVVEDCDNHLLLHPCSGDDTNRKIALVPIYDDDNSI